MKKLLTLILALVLALSVFAAAAMAEPEYTFTYAELNGDDNINSRVGYKFVEVDGKQKKVRFCKKCNEVME